MTDDTIPARTCACGCGAPAHRRFVRGHNRRTDLETAYRVDDATGCWVWLGQTNSRGYGRLVVNGRQTAAHRVYYERFVAPIPAGMPLDHLCRNKLCVNPTHLEPVTHAENVRRGLRPKLSMQSAREIRRQYADGLSSQRAIGAKYGVNGSVVCEIVNGKAWRE